MANVFDDELLAELAADLEADGLCRVLDVFTADLARRLEAMRAALQAGQTTTFANLAHQLAGAAAAIGASALAEECRLAMRACDEGAPPCTPGLNAIERLAGDVADAIAARRAEAPLA